ncbi:hypothetical protein ABZ330_21700 [Streptomyces sp. NPDC006172]|uniref:hypothetical protein n=1 Tax=Streptomyces sp. NPDC006172 TaxID=3154470 RepID=UPI0034001E4F
MPEPITPTRIIPAGESLPAPAAPPAPPPIPPAPPASWWDRPAAPPPPPQPPAVPVTPEIVVHTTVYLPVPDEPAPEPGVRWWHTFRPVYNLVCAAAGSPLAAQWADVLADARTEASLAGAWVIALVPLGVVALVDNVLAVTAANAAPRLWLPRLKAAASRAALWALLAGTAVALPVVTLVYVITGVHP